MKVILLFLFSVYTQYSVAQLLLAPGEGSFERKWIKSTSFEMNWYALRDTSKIKIGNVSTQILVTSETLQVVTIVNIKNLTTAWVDSTIAQLSTLKPIRHSSYNLQRDMVLNFGSSITGYYNDKVKNEYTIINDTAKYAYFDSNLYPILLEWLPLKLGYTQDISIYDYNPSAKIGFFKASVQEVKDGTYSTIKSGTMEVWIVVVTDEISNGVSTYYIDKKDRKLWRQEINAGGRQMLMQRVE